MNDTQNTFLQTLEAKWDKLQATVKEKMAERKLEKDIEEKMDRFKQKFQAFKESGGMQTEQMRAELEMAWDDLESTINRLQI